jgi:Cof subfamily protein (haloacid dehalogenase superfamily)
MIKLIATDLDGTLLNNKKQLPVNTYDIIKKVVNRGITFAVATGRSYHSVFPLFEDVLGDITIIAENGAIIIEQGEVVAHDKIELENVREIVETTVMLPGLSTVICGLKTAYFFEDRNILPHFPIEIVDSYFPKRQLINSLNDLPADEVVLKFAIFDANNDAHKNIYAPLSHLTHKYQIAVSGTHWTDIMNKGINKGIALTALQNKLQADPDETMVFGDELNDYEMMERAYYNYAMDNAVQKIKDIANFSAPDNESAGVIQVIENFLALTDALK